MSWAVPGTAFASLPLADDRQPELESRVSEPVAFS